MLNRRMLINRPRQRSAPREQKCAQDGGGQTMRKIDESSADTLKINQEINLQNELGLCFTISLFFRSYKSPSWLHWRIKHAISFKGFSIAAVKFVISASSRAITLSLLQSNIRSSEEVAIMSLRSPHNVRNADSSMDDEEGGCRKSARTCF